MTTNSKVDKREVGKERKALKAAQLDKAIENELLERLKQVSEGEIYNYPEKNYSKVLSKVGKEDEMNEEEEEEEENEMEEELEEEEEGEDYNVEYVEVSGGGGTGTECSALSSFMDICCNYTVHCFAFLRCFQDFEMSDDEDEEDLEDFEMNLGSKRKNLGSSSSRSSGGAAGKKSKAPKGPRVEVEYENEDEDHERVRQLIR